MLDDPARILYSAAAYRIIESSLKYTLKPACTTALEQVRWLGISAGVELAEAR